MAGPYRTGDGQAFDVSLQIPVGLASDGSDPNAIQVVEPPTLGPALGLDRWLLLIVLSLGVFEWISVRRGRMP